MPNQTSKGNWPTNETLIFPFTVEIRNELPRQRTFLVRVENFKISYRQFQRQLWLPLFDFQAAGHFGPCSRDYNWPTSHTNQLGTTFDNETWS